MSDQAAWRRCSSCKEPIAHGALYWTCSVSTCNRKRTALAFCKVSCWDAHLPVARHREAWAEEQTAPSPQEAQRQAASAGRNALKERRVVRPQAPAKASGAPPQEVLIVASRLKEYVRAVSGYNTSDGVLAPLSAHVRRVCDQAIRNAQREGRQTVLERDVPDA